MPTPTIHPRPAIVPWFDPRPWRGVVVARLGLADVTIPSDAEPFQDAITFASGRGVQRTLQTSLTANKTGAGTWTIGLDEDDRFYVEADVAFSIGACAPLGFSAAGLVGGGGPTYRRTAQADWVRGQVADLAMTITPAASAAFQLVVAGKRTTVQSPVTYLVGPGTDPYDGTKGTPSTYNFSALVAAAATRDDFHASFDAEGHLVLSWAVAPLLGWTWVDSSFARACGFDTTELPTFSGNIVTLRAAHPFPGLHVSQHGAVRLEEGAGEEVTRTRLRSGAQRAARRGYWQTLAYETWVYGQAAAVDELAHLARRSRRLWHEGALVSLYREWGDPRWAQDLLESSGGQYDAYRTPEADGRHGRRRYYVAAPPAALAFDSEGLEYRALMSLQLEEAP